MDTWTCHVCGDERPDENIAVLRSHKRFGTVVLSQNVRYCVDRLECAEGAAHVDFLPGLED